MPIKIRTKEQTAEITHPQYPDAGVKVRRPFSNEFQHLSHLITTKRYPLKDPDTGEFVRSKNGKKIETYEEQVIPREFINAVLEATIIDWWGFENDEGPIEFNKSVVARVLYETESNVKIDVETDDPDKKGEKKMVEVTQPFGAWVANLVLDQKTFDPDPLGKR